MLVLAAMLVVIVLEETITQGTTFSSNGGSFNPRG